MTEEERRVMELLGSSSTQADQVTGQVLKLCNVVRQRLDVHGPDTFIKKRSGLGGAGGRRLSPELRIRYGTFGFKSKNNQTRGSNQAFSLLDERVTSANTMPIDSAYSQDRPHMQGRAHERNMSMRDSMDSIRSMHAPPNVVSSVDMGMREESLINHSGEFGSSSGAR